MKELHLHFFDEYKDLIYRWYKDIKENGSSGRNKQSPPYKNPDNGELLDYDTLVALPLEKQFQALFPTLSEETWKDEGSRNTHWDLRKRPYILKIENNSGYGQDCHFCNSYQCRYSCPLPYTSK